MPAQTKTVLVQQAYRFALDPTPTQERAFRSHAGGARYAYNWGLDQYAAALDGRREQQAAGQNPTISVPSHFQLCKLWTAYKNDPDSGLGWVGENAVKAYQSALRDVVTAWKAFHRGLRGEGPRVGRPRYKKRGRRDAFQLYGVGLHVVDTRHVQLPRIGAVRVHESTRKIGRRLRAGTARLVRATISRTAQRWYVSLTVEVQRQVPVGPSFRQRRGGCVGLDLGLQSLLVLSNGMRIARPPRLANAHRKLAACQRAMTRSKTGSRRRERRRQRVARAHARVAALRLDFTHKLSTSLVRHFAAIGVEGWSVRDVMTHGSPTIPRRFRAALNRQLADASLGELRSQLEYKGPWHGAAVLVADRLAPTGRTCSACAAVRTKPLRPADEQFLCLSCGYIADRRINTARVLAAMAREHLDDASSAGESENARGGPVRPASPRGRRRGPVRREARTRSPGRQAGLRGQTGSPGGQPPGIPG